MANEGLVLRFGSDTSGATKAIQQLSTTVVSNLTAISSTAIVTYRNIDQLPVVFQRVAANANAIGSLASNWQLLAGGIIAGAVAFKAIEAGVASAKQQLQDMLDVADKAGKVGVSPTFFQAFTAAEQASKASADELGDALTHAFQATKEQLDQTLPVLEKLKEDYLAGFFSEGDQHQGLQLFRDAQTQDQKIQAVLVAMKELDAIGQHLAALQLGDIMFGSAFTDKIRLGQRSISDMIDQINNKLAQGVANNEIISDASVQRAKELNDRLTDAWHTVDQNLKPSWQLLGDLALAIEGAWTKVVELLAQASSALGGENIQHALEWAGRIGAFIANPTMGGQQLSRAILGEIGGDASLDRLIARAQAGSTGINEFGGVPGGGTPSSGGIPLPRPRPDNAPAGRATATATERVDSVERYTQQLERAVEQDNAELATVGKMGPLREQLLALANAQYAASRDGRDLTEDEINKVTELARQHSNLKDRIAEEEAAIRRNADAMRYFGDAASNALGEIIVDGKSAASVLSSLLATLEKAAITGLITGTGPFGVNPASAAAGSSGLGGIIGALFGGGRAGGGDVSAGQIYRVNENGPEYFAPSQSGRVIPIGAGGGASGGVNVAITMAPTFQAGISPADQAYIRAQLEQTKRETVQLAVAQIRTGLRSSSSYLNGNG